MKLTNPTDNELNAAFASEVAGWTRVDLGHGVYCWKHPRPCDGELSLYPLENFIGSADGVMPWLEKWHWGGHSNGMSMSTHGYPHYSIWIDIPAGPRFEAHIVEGDSVATAFPRAAVIALLRVHGVEVEFTR